LLVATALVFSAGAVRAQSADEGSTAQTCGPDFPVPDGRFFVEAEGATGLGYSVIDDQQATFWQAFQALGGVEALGRPISLRFQLDGFLVQAFERAVLQWNPAGGTANVLNTLDVLQQLGYDEWLAADPWRIPPHQQLAEDADAAFEQVVRNHLALLDEAFPEIGEAFESTPDWLMRLGLPIAYADHGDLRVLRAQRGVLRQAVSDGQGGPVELIGAGTLAKEAGLVPVDAQAGTQARLPEDLTGLLRVDPEIPAQGSTVVLTLVSGYAGATLSWDGQPLPLVCNAGQWHALVGLASTIEPGEHLLRVGVGEASGESSVAVTERVFPHEVIELSGDLIDLLDEELSRQEREFFGAIIAPVSGPPAWDGAFQSPADGQPSSGYGERRTFEPGSIASVHQGTDIAAPQGSAVRAPSRGTVAWAGPLTIRGNVVVLDHGFGVYSAFYHLDRIDVAAGAEVGTGDVIGAVGSTGRATGPHLHWEVRVLGEAVDPDEWLDRTLDAITGWASFVPAEPTAPPTNGEPATPADDGDGTTQPAPDDDPPAGENGNGNGSSGPPGVETGVPPDEGPAG
jgi:hypothetical protein